MVKGLELITILSVLERVAFGRLHSVMKTGLVNSEERESH